MLTRECRAALAHPKCGEKGLARTLPHHRMIAGTIRRPARVGPDNLSGTGEAARGSC